jgi:hypothetical protein
MIYALVSIVLNIPFYRCLHDWNRQIYDIVCVSIHRSQYSLLLSLARQHTLWCTRELFAIDLSFHILLSYTLLHLSDTHKPFGINLWFCILLSYTLLIDRTHANHL